MTLRQLITPCAFGLSLLMSASAALADSTWESGEQVYAKVCGHCHEAGIGPVLTGRQLPPPYITAIVRHGFRAMPAFRSAFIDDAALQAVADYISKSPAAPGKE